MKPRLPYGATVLLALLVFAVPVALAARDARGSTSIAVTLESLVHRADAVAVVAPEEAHAVWENGRIVTYTRLRVESVIGGISQESVLVRSLGGLVDGIGQFVEGEAAFPSGSRSLVFLARGATPTDAWHVVARAQGAYPIAATATGTLRLARPAHAYLVDRAGVREARAVDELTDRPLSEMTALISIRWRAHHGS